MVIHNFLLTSMSPTFIQLPTSINSPPPAIPQLIEPGARYFFDQWLHHSHEQHLQYRNDWLTCLWFILFFLIVGVFLWSRYRGFPSDDDMKQEEAHRLHLIMGNLQRYQQARLLEQQQLITGLPFW